MLNQARAVLLVLVLSGTTLAGCLSAETVEPGGIEEILAKVSQVVYGKVIAEHTPIESFDGTIIDAWTFRPDVGEADVAGEKVPVIINFSPYWSNLAPPAATGGDAFSLYLIDYYVPRGYAVALVSARGTGLSEGCFTIGGPAEVQDEDVVATFFGTQEWSNGNVTATGKSYDGTMAQSLITTGNPHVKTIVPVSPISELYKYNYFHGVPYGNGFGTNQFNTYYVLGVSVSQGAGLYRPGIPGEQDLATYEKTPTRFCDESIDVQTNQYHSVLLGDYTPYWQERNYSAMLPDEVPSVFYIHGLQDWNVKPDHMVPWLDELQARNATVKMWLGQWEHDYPTRDDWNLTMLRWFDHYLKGVDTGILQEPLVQVQDNEGTWRHEEDWPLTRGTDLRLYTSGDGTLASAPGTGASGWDDIPAGRTALFETTLEESLRLAGAPTFYARVTSLDGPRATLSAILRLDGEIINEGFLDLYHRDTLESGTPMRTGTAYDVTVLFHPQDVVLPAGSKLSLEIAHTSPGPSNIAPNPTGTTMLLQHGNATNLVMPTIPADDITPEERQPEDVTCWAC